MVKHVILWKFKGMENPAQQKKLVKDGLEGLMGKVDGITSIKVTIENLESSNCDAMLEMEAVDFDALKGYSTNPLHVNVAETYIRPYIETRLCFDYEI